MSNPPNNQENQPQENRPTESINTTTSANSSIIKGGRVLTKDLLSMLQKMQKDQQKFNQQQQEINTRILNEIKMNDSESPEIPEVKSEISDKESSNNKSGTESDNAEEEQEDEEEEQQQDTQPPQHTHNITKPSKPKISHTQVPKPTFRITQTRI